MAGSVLVVGAGIIGRLAAWRLAEAGHSVTLLDPGLATVAPGNGLSGSQAALGVLMARVFHRSSGRAWRLRQQSHALWDDWLAELERRGHPLPRRRGLLLLAASPEDLERQERIAADRARLGIPMQRLNPAELAHLQPALPGPPVGGLLSPEDGQIDPAPLLEALLQEARQAGVRCVGQAAMAIERGPATGRRWRVRIQGGWLEGGRSLPAANLPAANLPAANLEADWLVLALGLGAAPLLAGLGHALALEPVLGQALELELAPDAEAAPTWSWPGVVVWRGLNLVPRPPQPNGAQRLWLGATVEPGDSPDPMALVDLRHLGGEAPRWLQRGTLVRHWHGLRVRPVGQPAPVLSEPEPGLLLAGGHYRNGVLLAPATAAWLLERMEHMEGLAGS